MAHEKRRIKKGWKVLGIVLLCLALCAAALLIWKQAYEYLAYLAPPDARADMEPVVNKAQWTQADYELIYRQTGVAEAGADALRAAGRQRELLTLQENFYTAPNYTCAPNSIISFEEHVTDEDGKWTSATSLVPLEDGDILITKSSHVYGWRNGHAALVVDAENGITLESVVLGTNSCTQNLNKWTTFPNFMVLRVKDMDKQTRAEVAAWAMEHLNGVAYDFSMGVLRPKEQEDGNYIGTQCSHLVWAAYKAFGYDLDADGGMIVTPKDLANSPLLEVVQVYGVDPSAIWP